MGKTQEHIDIDNVAKAKENNDIDIVEKEWRWARPIEQGESIISLIILLENLMHQVAETSFANAHGKWAKTRFGPLLNRLIGKA